MARVAAAWLARNDPARAVAVLEGEDRSQWPIMAAWADVAASEAARGDETSARRRLTELSQDLPRLQGHGADRARLHMARALAAVGELEAARTILEPLNPRVDLRGELQAFRATTLAAQGRVQEGLQLLDELSDETRYDVQVARVRGYLEIARQRNTPTNNAALASAWRAAMAVPDWQQHQLRLESVELWVAMGNLEEARRRLHEVVEGIPTHPVHAHLFAPILGRLGATAAKLGETELATILRQRLDEWVPRLLDIERPELVAMCAEIEALCGRRSEAAARYHQAIEGARQLINPRPRALAGLGIALSMDRCGWRDEDTLVALQRVLETFAS